MRREPITGGRPIGSRSRQVLALSAPIVGGMAATNVMNLVDAAMVGQLGAETLAGVGLGVVLLWLVAALYLGLGAAVQTLVAWRVGQGEAGKAAGFLNAGLAAAAAIGVPLGLGMALLAPGLLGALADDPVTAHAGGAYLQIRLAGVVTFGANMVFRGYWYGVARPRTYLWVNIVINGLNIFGNWVLIFGNLGAPALGAGGAAMASVAAETVGTLLYLAATRGVMRRARRSAGRLRALVTQAWPTAVENAMLFVGVLVFFAVAQMVSTEALAVTHALGQVALVAAQLSLGFGMAGATLVGTALGRASADEALEWARTTARVACLAALPFAAVLAATPGFWLDAVIPDGRAIPGATTALAGLAAALPLDAAGIAVARMVVGAGAVQRVLAWSVALQWGVFLPVAWLLASTGVDVGALWLCFAAWRVLFAAVMWHELGRPHWRAVALA